MRWDVHYLFRFGQNLRDDCRAPATSFTVLDLLVYLAILLLGALQFFFYLRAPDLVMDATYFELTRSILEKGSYQFDFRPETLLPPGLPFILAVFCFLVGSGPGVLFHLMAISTTLGLAATYTLLRRIGGRTIAAIACLLLGSSPALFTFTTRLVFSDMPYFFTSMLTLGLAYKADITREARARTRWILLCGSSLVLTLMIRSAGIAILIAFCAWVLFSFFVNSSLGWRRLKLALVPLILGISSQLLWTAWASRKQMGEWPLPGYPGSYLSQLRIKNGNDPELGMARLRDIPERVGQNLDERSIELAKLLTRLRWINPHWSSPAVFGLLMLVLLGLISSIWKGGGQVYDWYFAINELMYLFWPWNFEMRFLLPTVPFACLYLWRGAITLRNLTSQRPRETGICVLLFGSFLTVSSLLWFIQSRSLQALVAIGCWTLLLLAGSAIVSQSYFNVSTIDDLLSAITRMAQRVATPVRVMGLLMIASLVVLGTALQLKIARYNMHFDLTTGIYYPDIEAAQWIQAHEPAGLVVMARKEDLVYHYTHHRVVWFPPLRDPQLLISGIRRYHVGAVVIVDRHGNSYWQPPEDACFRSVQQAYGSMFHLIHHGPNNWIFAVDTTDNSWATGTTQATHCGQG